MTETPDLWWIAKREEFFLCIDGAYYVAQVEAEDSPLGAGRPADAVKLVPSADVEGLRAAVLAVLDSFDPNAWDHAAFAYDARRTFAGIRAIVEETPNA